MLPNVAWFLLGLPIGVNLGMIAADWKFRRRIGWHEPVMLVAWIMVAVLLWNR